MWLRTHVELNPLPSIVYTLVASCSEFLDDAASIDTLVPCFSFSDHTYNLSRLFAAFDSCLNLTSFYIETTTDIVVLEFWRLCAERQKTHKQLCQTVGIRVEYSCASSIGVVRSAVYEMYRSGPNSETFGIGVQAVQSEPMVTTIVPR